MDDKLNNWMAYKINQYKENEDALKEYVSHLDKPASYRPPPKPAPKLG